MPFTQEEELMNLQGQKIAEHSEDEDEDEIEENITRHSIPESVLSSTQYFTSPRDGT